MSTLRTISIGIAAMMATCVILSGCTSRTEPAPKTLRDDYLVKVGKRTFTHADLLAAMPGGLSKDDSVRYARFTLRQWIDRELANDLAENDLDMTEIDRLVDEYRHELIMRQYAARMFQAHVDTAFNTDTLHAYYDAHPELFKLQRPLVKGVYLKIPDDAANLATIRKLYRSTKPADIDRLEKEVLSTATHYDYFRDRWIDWEQVEKRIPYDFGRSSDDFLRQKGKLDHKADGFVYLLEISEFLPSGATMPYEAAEPLIRRRLMAERRRDYELHLRDDIYEDAVQKGRLKLNVQL